MQEDNAKLAERIARLEGALGWTEKGSLNTTTFVASMGLVLASLYLGYRGLGEPNHHYQLILAVLVIGVGYHRHTFFWPKKVYHWLLPLLNIASVGVLLKVVIGGGTRHPFFWFLYPSIQSKKSTNLVRMIPEWSITWQPTDLATWNIDLTVIQTLFVILMVLGATMGFQLFASLVAFLLLIVSIPVLASFDWQWVFPALICSGIGIYLQMVPRPRHPH